MGTSGEPSTMPILPLLIRVHCRGNPLRTEAVLAMAQEGFSAGVMADLARRLRVSRQRLEYWRDRFRAEVAPALEAEGYQVPEGAKPRARARAGR